MNKTIFVAGGVVVALALSLFAVFSSDSTELGGRVHQVQEEFAAGIKAGTNSTEIINSNGIVTGPVSGKVGLHGSTSADVTLTKAQVQASKFYVIDTAQTSTVTVTLPSVDAADVGKELEFVIVAASSTNSLNVNAASGVTFASSSAMASSTLVSIPDAVGDSISCTYLTTVSVFCKYFAQEE